MVDKKLRAIIEKYDISYYSETNSNVVDMVYLDSKKASDLKLVIAYIDRHIYSVSFLNNEFFEMRHDDDLYRVVEAIIVGEYDVYSKGLFKRKKAIVVHDNQNDLYPERVYSDKEYREQYNTLPFKW